MTDTGTAREAFLAELTQKLTASGWTRTDRDHFGLMTTEFTHSATHAVLTITDTARTSPSAFLLHDGTDAWWRVACYNPHPAVLAAAANATLHSDTTSTSHGGDDRPLKQRLQEAGWTVEHESGNAGQILASRWTGPDCTEAVCFPNSTFSPRAWLIHRSTTATGTGLARYTPTPATPPAVLAALTLTPAHGPAQTPRNPEPRTPRPERPSIPRRARLRPPAPAGPVPHGAGVKENPSMATTSRWSAGPGAPGLLLDLLAAEGWTAQPDTAGNTTCTSPDGTLTVVFGPEMAAYHYGGPLWAVTHTPDDPAVSGDYGINHPAGRWTATFGDEVPVEAIAAFLADLIGPEPLDPHRADDYPAKPSEPKAN